MRDSVADPSQCPHKIPDLLSVLNQFQRQIRNKHSECRRETFSTPTCRRADEAEQHGLPAVLPKPVAALEVPGEFRLLTREPTAVVGGEA